jgi:hypothetical protein
MRQTITWFSASLVVSSLLAAPAISGEITVSSALEDEEIAAYLEAAREAMPDLTVNVLRLSTGNLGARLIAEAGNPQADVLWGFAITNIFNPAIYDLLDTHAPDGIDDLPALFRDADNRWFAPIGYSFDSGDLRIKLRELCSRVFCCELPVCFGALGVAICRPRSNIGLQRIFVWNASAQTLASEDAEFAFSDVEPRPMFRSVVPFEPLRDAPCLVSWESLVERCRFVGVEIVLHEIDLFGIGEVEICKVAQNMGIIDSGTPIAYRDVTPAFQRSE